MTSREILFPNGKAAYRNKKNIVMDNPLAAGAQQANTNLLDLPVFDIVTFDKLGNNGRLGNQLFQIAATIAIAKRNNAVCP